MDTFYSLAAFNIFLPGIIAIIRFRAIHRVYRPFLYCLWVGCTNEVLSHFLILNGQYTLVNNNVYVLLESLFLVWLFRELGTLRQRGQVPALVLLLAGAWVAETFIFGSLTLYSRMFRIFYSFVVVFLSINTINKMLFSHRRRLISDATFLLCLSFIIFFTYKALIGSFALYDALGRTTFLRNLFNIMNLVNFVTNLLYALAVLWMPGKPKYLQPSLSPSA
jgi:hypothetical protein